MSYTGATLNNLAISISDIIWLKIESRLDGQKEEDKILDLKQLSDYTGWSTNYIYKNSHKIQHIQNGKRGKLRFRKSDIDKYLETQTSPGLRK